MGLFLFYIYFSLLFSQAENLQIVHYETPEEIDNYYCKTTTGTPEAIAHTPCSTPNYYPFDIIYLPKDKAEAILDHVESARSQKYFHELSNSDFFHGHPLRGGAINSYSSPMDFFDSIKAMLYHSEEYTSYWYKQSLIEPDPLKRSPRSFFAWLNKDTVFPAINGMPLTSIPKQYDSTGTIYSEQLIAGLLDLSLDQLIYSNAIFIKTCSTCKPCKVLDQIYILKDNTGRFLTKNNERVELSIQCKYIPEY